MENMKALRYFTAAVALVAWASCTNEELDSGGFASDPDAVRIIATVADLQSRSNPIDPDAEKRKSFNVGDKITIESENQSDVVYIYDGTNWSPEGEAYLKWNKDVQKFSAYYPSRYSSLQRDQRTLEALQMSDRMTVYNSVQTKGANRFIVLNLERATLRIVISKTIEWGSQYEGYIVSDLQIHTPDDYIIQPYSDDKDNYYALMLGGSEKPQSTFLTIKIKKSNDADAQEITHTVTGIPLLEEGKSYHFELRIGRDKAEISSVTVEDWQPGKVVEGEIEATPVPDTSSEPDGENVNTP